MHSESFKLGEFIDKGYCFDVPKLQRGYVWDRRHSKQFIRSIKEHKALDMDLFLGVVIFYDDGADESKLEVIDGQQRLTTIAMLCRMLVDHEELFLKPLDEWSKDDLKDECRQRDLTVGGNKSALYKRVLENTTWLKLNDMVYQDDGTSRIFHNTIPDDENFAMVIGDHSDYYAKETVRLEKKKVFDAADDLKVEMAATKKRVKGNTGSTDAEKEAAMQNWRDARDAKIVAEEELKLAATAAKMPWKKKLGQKVPMASSYEALSNSVRASLETPDDLDDLKEFVEFLLQRVEIVNITVDKKNQRHKVFKSLNAFGKDLTASEKIKNDLLSFGTDVQRETLIAGAWKDIEAKLDDIPMASESEDVITDFLWNYCKAHGITTPADWEGTSSTLKRENTYPVFDCEGGIYDTECKKLGGDRNLKADRTMLIAFLEKLKIWAEGYKKIQKPELLFISGVSVEWVNEIVDIRSVMAKQTRPYLLGAYMKTIGNPPGSVPRFESLVRCLSVALVRLVCSGLISPNKLETPIQKMTTTVHKNAPSDAYDKVMNQVKELINKHYRLIHDVGTLDWNNSADDAFKDQLENHSNFAPAGAKYILRGCEGIRHWRVNTRELVMDFHNTGFYTVEHILPDNSGPFKRQTGRWWDEHEAHDTFDDPDGGAKEAPRVYEDSRRKLGNFVILENKLNGISGTKTWGGKGEFDRGIRRADSPEEDSNPLHWGKFHVYAHSPWSYARPGQVEQPYNGSHLISIKRFCSKYADEDHWSAKLIADRSKELAEKAKRRKNWKFW